MDESANTRHPDHKEAALKLCDVSEPLARTPLACNAKHKTFLLFARIRIGKVPWASTLIMEPREDTYRCNDYMDHIVSIAISIHSQLRTNQQSTGNPTPTHTFHLHSASTAVVSAWCFLYSTRDRRIILKSIS